jgi:hypothetical protein
MAEPPPAASHVKEPALAASGDAAAGAGPASAAIRVILADDSVLFREGLARVLADNGFIVAGQRAMRAACTRRWSGKHPTSW